jgi:hypothetical protein
MQEFCRYPDLLRHSASFIEHFARTFLAGRVKAIKLFLQGNNSPGVSAPIVELPRLRYGYVTVALAFKAFAKAIPMLNAFSRDIRSIRAQENIGVHSGLPCSSNISLKSVTRS